MSSDFGYMISMNFADRRDSIYQSPTVRYPAYCESVQIVHLSFTDFSLRSSPSAFSISFRDSAKVSKITLRYHT